MCCLRATRDKLPRGLYTVSVALHSRLGGPALAWSSKEEQQQWVVSTEPIKHQGRFYDTDLHINQSLFMVREFFDEMLGKSRKLYILKHDVMMLLQFRNDSI